MQRCTRSALVAVLLLTASSALAGEWSACDRGVCVFLRGTDEVAWIDASNELDVPVGVKIDFTRILNASALPQQAETVVEPRGYARVVKLMRKGNGRMHFPFKWIWVFGDPRATHDDGWAYRMPFGGLYPRELTQGVKGQFSHNGSESYAFDFGMPVGTPILAARSGRVVGVADGYTRSGITDDYLNRANAVTILHEDGTFASYGHLDPGSGVRQGMAVRTGDLIGFSGNTGYSTGPHLHFSVWRPKFLGGHETLPIRFHRAGARAFVPMEGVTYAAGCHDEGRKCEPGELPDEAEHSDQLARAEDGSCRCANGSVITTRLPCRMVCPKN